MTTVTRSIEIDRPVEDVFAYVNDIANDPVWQPTLLETRQVTEGPMVVGTRVRETRRFLGVRFESEYEVTEWDPPTRSAVRSTDGPIPASGSYTTQPVGRGTRFTMVCEIDAHGFFRLAEPVFSRMAAREIDAMLGQLKDLLEAGVPVTRAA